VSAAPPTDRNRHDAAPRTLGDLLYADKGKHCVPESVWVALVRSIAAGDQEALRVLYEHTHRIVFTLTMRITGNQQTAEELTLDVYQHVWRRAGAYDPAGGSVVGWIANQARSRAIDRLRYERRQKRAAPDAVDPTSIAATPDSQEAVELREQARALQTALAALKPDERLAIETAFFSELTYAETAARLHQPLGTVKTRIRSGLDKLRAALTASTEGR
jgi:RNA polymerase sigma-70 factor (ECF subfamily)